MHKLLLRTLSSAGAAAGGRPRPKQQQPSILKQFHKEIQSCASAADLESLVQRSPATHFNDVNIARTIVRLGELGSANKPALDDMLRRASGVRFKPGELMDLCYSFTQLKPELTGRRIPRFLTDQIAQHTAIPHFKPRFFSFILYSYVELNQLNEPELCKAMATGLTQMESLSRFGLDDFAIILDSLAVLNAPGANEETRAVAERFAMELLKPERDFSKAEPADLVLLFCAMHRQNVSDALLSKLAREMQSRLPDFSKEELNVVLDAVSGSQEGEKNAQLAELCFAIGEEMDGRWLQE